MTEIDKLKILKGQMKEYKDNRIWITKKSRIESEKRLNKNHMFSQFLINYYTVVILGLSIWGLVIIEKSLSSKVSLLTVIASVCLFGISLFVSSFNYREKALQFKNSYLSLNELETNLDYLIESDMDINQIQMEFKELKKQYNAILEKTENHETIDYLVVKRKSSTGISFEDSMEYLFYIIKMKAVKVVLIIAPILFIIFIR